MGVSVGFGLGPVRVSKRIGRPRRRRACHHRGRGGPGLVDGLVALDALHRQRQATRPAPTPRMARPQRTTWTEALTAHPELEVKWWFLWVATTVFAAVPSPASLLITLPVGVYLLYVRAEAAKRRAQAARDALPPFDHEAAARHAAEWGFPTDVYDHDGRRSA
jgi:hypothetical protein